MNGFDDLGDAEQDSEESDDAATESTKTTNTTETTMSETTTEPEPEPEQTTKSLDEPAFSFDEATQDAIYARQESIDVLGDALAELDVELRKRDLRDVPKREKHDALARLAGDHVEELADLIEEARQ